jgi:hypothetical protein
VKKSGHATRSRTLFVTRDDTTLQGGTAATPFVTAAISVQFQANATNRNRENSPEFRRVAHDKSRGKRGRTAEIVQCQGERDPR